MISIENTQSMTTEEIIRLSAKVATEETIKVLAMERQKEHAARAANRLYNVRYLLQNYRSIKQHVENAVFDTSEIADELDYDVLELMNDAGNKIVQYVESLKKSVARSVLFVRHIDAMLAAYKRNCAGCVEDERRYRIIKALYVDDPGEIIDVIAQAENITVRTAYNDLNAAYDSLAPLLFGIDGLERPENPA